MDELALNLEIKNIQKKGYDFIFIDENGIIGTIDNITQESMNEIISNSTIKEKDTRRNYYYIDNGKKQKLPWFVRRREEKIKELGLLPDEIEEEIEEFDIELFSPSVITNKNKRLYILHNNYIISYIGAMANDIDVNIDFVEVNPNYRNKRLCRLMMKLFIRIVNNSRKLTFSLKNAGGEISCRCYVNAFTEIGYKSYYNVEENEWAEINIANCNIEPYRMKFVYQQSSGGKRKSRIHKRKSRAHKKLINKTIKKYK